MIAALLVLVVSQSCEDLSCSGSVSAGTVLTTTVIPPLAYQGLLLYGRRASDDWGSSADVVIRSYVHRTAGNLLEVSNYGDTLAWVDFTGTIVSRASDTPAFIDASGISSHTSLTCEDFGYGCAAVVRGRARNYGYHGATTVGNEYPRDGGYLLEVNNGGGGGMTDKVLMVNNQGGLVQLGGYSLAQFWSCPGQADPGTLMYAADTIRWYSCRPDAGWVQLGTP